MRGFPNASVAVGDAAGSAFKRKLRRYRTEIRELAAAGIAYRPMVWTANGRPHPAVTRTLHFAAAQAANRSERNSDPSALVARWEHEIQVALMRRRAAMARAVLPRLGHTDAWMLTGFTVAAPAATGRAAPLASVDEVDAANAPDEDLGEEPDDDEGTT